MSEKRQVAARGRHTDDRITAKFYSQNRILKSRADWDHSDASITWVRSPGEPGMTGRPPWEKMRPLGVSICLQQGSKPQGVAPESWDFPRGHHSDLTLTWPITLDKSLHLWACILYRKYGVRNTSFSPDTPEWMICNELLPSKSPLSLYSYHNHLLCFQATKKPTILQQRLKTWCNTCLTPGKKAGQLIPKHTKYSLLISSSHWAAHVYQASMVCRPLFVEATSMKNGQSTPLEHPNEPQDRGSRKTPTLRMTDPLSRAAAKLTSPWVSAEPGEPALLQGAEKAPQQQGCPADPWDLQQLKAGNQTRSF